MPSSARFLLRLGADDVVTQSPAGEGRKMGLSVGNLISGRRKEDIVAAAVAAVSSLDRFSHSSARAAPPPAENLTEQRIVPRNLLSLVTATLVGVAPNRVQGPEKGSGASHRSWFSGSSSSQPDSCSGWTRHAGTHQQQMPRLVATGRWWCDGCNPSGRVTTPRSSESGMRTFFFSLLKRLIAVMGR